jgi:hypothetical protein
MTHAELVAIVEGIVPVVRDALRAAVADLPALHEKMVALEGQVYRARLEALTPREPVPGPLGPAGPPGPPGAAGLELDDDVDYAPGKAYTPGKLVRYKSALWACRAETTLAPDAVTYDADGKPAGPQGKDFWKLLLRDGKRGRDGKDGSVGPQGKPGRDWQQVYDETRHR